MSPLSLTLTACVYFVAGTMREYVLVQYYRAMTGGKSWCASGLAGGIEVYDILVLAYIIKGDWNPVSIAAYTLGVMVGTYFGTRRKKDKDNA